MPVSSSLYKNMINYFSRIMKIRFHIAFCKKYFHEAKLYGSTDYIFYRKYENN